MDHSIKDLRPDLSQSIADQITVSDRAVVVPPTEGTSEGITTTPMGAVDSEGRFLTRSITFRGPIPLNYDAVMPPESEIEEMPGRYMFGGIMFGHFGHSLVETMARLWALDFIGDKIDGVIFIPKNQESAQRVLEVRTPLYRTFGVRHTMYNLEQPARVDRLYVPQQGFGIFDMIGGAPEFRRYIRNNVGRDIEPAGPRRIYISRTGLKNLRGGLLGESLLETWLQKMGYTPFYPEKFSIDEQIAAYRAADYIIGLDGSPLHLLALVGCPDQKVACISRRKGAVDDMFVTQFKSFLGLDLVVANAIHSSWVPQGRRVAAHLGIGEASFRNLWKILRAADMIPESAPWPDLSPRERRAFLEPFEKNYGTRMIRTRV